MFGTTFGMTARFDLSMQLRMTTNNATTYRSSGTTYSRLYRLFRLMPLLEGLTLTRMWRSFPSFARLVDLYPTMYWFFSS